MNTFFNKKTTTTATTKHAQTHTQIHTQKKKKKRKWVEITRSNSPPFSF